MLIKLKTRLALYNLFSKLVFTLVFIVVMPLIFERINLRQVDKDLIRKREDLIKIISESGIEPFLLSDSTDAFGSFDILKEEFLGIEKIDTGENLNYIDISERLIDNELITYRILTYSFRVDGELFLLEVGKSLTSIYRNQKNLYRVLIILWGAVIIITLLSDLQYSRMLLKPLDQITGKLTKISTPSKFDKSKISTATADFAKLDEALSSLMEHIENLFNKEKEITANISHELLTPVSIIRSKLENLLLSDESPEERAAKIEESLKTLYRLKSLINSFLLVARIESRQFLRNDAFNLKSVLDDIENEINPVAEDKGITIKAIINPDFYFREANRSLIFSMFFNIINNAVAHTHGGGTVTIMGYNDMSGTYTVTVTDSGKGMSQKQIDIIFSRFKSKDEDNPGSHGIGLAISKSIADFHEIDLSVTSEPGQGSTFIFKFLKTS